MADGSIPQQLHLDLSVRDVDELDRVHGHVLALGGILRLDRSQDAGEPLRVYVDPDGHPFCVFVAHDPVADSRESDCRAPSRHAR